jgi:hypothetical protein
MFNIIWHLYIYANNCVSFKSAFEFLFPLFIVKTKKSTHDTFLAQTCKALRVEKYVVLGFQDACRRSFGRGVSSCVTRSPRTRFWKYCPCLLARDDPLGRSKLRSTLVAQKSRLGVPGCLVLFSPVKDSSSFEPTVYTHGRCPPCPPHKKKSRV